MSVHKEGESYSYWPGYVDALTNIVLNLLFLVAIFVIGVAALGLVAAQGKGQPEAVSTPQPTTLERIKNVARKIIASSPANPQRGVEVEVSQKSKTDVTLDGSGKQTDAAVVRLAFAQDSYLMNKAEELAVLRQISAVLEVPAKSIRIWTVLPPDDALLVRGAMVRLLSVRNMLLHHGVAPELIEVQIVSQSVPSKTTGHVFIEINKKEADVEKK